MVVQEKVFAYAESQIDGCQLPASVESAEKYDYCGQKVYEILIINKVVPKIKTRLFVDIKTMQVYVIR